MRLLGCAVVAILSVLPGPASAQAFSLSMVCPRTVGVGETPSLDVTLTNWGIDSLAVRVVTTMVGQGVVETLEDVAVLGPAIVATVEVPADTVLEVAVVVPTAVPESFLGKAFSQVVVATGPEGTEAEQCLIAVPEPKQHWLTLAMLVTIGILRQCARGRSNPRPQQLETS